MRILMTTTSLRNVFAALLAASLVGCNVTGATATAEPFPTAPAPPVQTAANSDAGLEVKPSTDVAKLTTYVAARDKAGAFGTARTDPFALTTMEKYFETQQSTERFFMGGGFGTYVTPKPPVEENVVPFEEQPYRRLSGIIVGDSVLAILEEGNTATIITPGMKLPNSPWTVASIDADKAVLRRSGNVRPTQVIVRLETKAYDPSGAGAGGDTNPGGPPGGPPPGYQGGPNGPGGPGRTGPGGRGGGD